MAAAGAEQDHEETKTWKGWVGKQVEDLYLGRLR